MKELQRKLFFAFGLLALIFVIGITGFVLIEKLSLIDAVYVTVVTLATVGYGDISPKTNIGKIFDILLIMCGMSTFIYAVTTITAFFVEGELGGYLRRRKMQKIIENLREHYIICGSGDVGKYIIDELYKTKRKFVVIENNPEIIKELQEKKDMLYVEGNAADDTALLNSGIKYAKGLVTTLPTDKDNLFVVITARSLNVNLRIVTRSIDDASVPKLTRAGADAIVSPNAIGGLRMASVLIRPSVVSFLDKMLRGSDISVRVEEIEVTENSKWIDKTLQETQIMEKIDIVPIAIKNKFTETYQHNPKPSYIITKNDIFIVIGNSEQTEKLRLLIQN